ncbi:MAG: phospho-N-acetylmuramoyl-pentapeptide-transferase, partial [Ilumatobacteraceae bacterium]
MIAVMISGAVAMFVSLFGTRFLIRYFRMRGTGQPILGKEDHGPEHHMTKQGTPTMGGLAIIGAALVGWVVGHLRPGIPFSDQAMIMWVGVLAMALMGFLDDFIKVRKRHNRGIFWKKKSYITLGMSILLAWWLVAETGVAETISLTRATWPGWDVPWPVFVVFAGVMIWSTSNAVNVTDGLDGLAGGSAMLGFLAFTIIAYWAFRNPDVYGAVVNPLDLAVFAAAFAGACGGFLWYNAAPARIFMGDVGALALGTALALLAITADVQLLLILICGINVIEAGSVAIQMGVFKA